MDLCVCVYMPDSLSFFWKQIYFDAFLLLSWKHTFFSIVRIESVVDFFLLFSLSQELVYIVFAASIRFHLRGASLGYNTFSSMKGKKTCCFFSLHIRASELNIFLSVYIFFCHLFFSVSLSLCFSVSLGCDCKSWKSFAPCTQTKSTVWLLKFHFQLNANKRNVQHVFFFFAEYQQRPQF